MPLRIRFLLLILGLGVIGMLTAPVAADNDADKIDQLIEQLGSGAFKDRESATKALDAIGAPALEKLRKAAESEDLEIKRRAADLVKRIEKRAEVSRVLQAKRVHLVYKDTLLKDAVADFKKKSGYDVALHDPDSKLGDRKITLDTGDVTFWEAFDKFCDAAGVQQVTQQDMMRIMMKDMMEKQQQQMEIMRQRKPAQAAPKEAPQAPAPKKADEKPKVEEKPKDKPKQEDKDNKELAAAVEAVAALQDEVVAVLQLGGGGGGGVVQVQVQPAPPAGGAIRLGGAGGMRGFPAISPDQITVMDGKRKAQPTQYAGSVRIRATDPVPVPAGEESPLMINLQVSTEPRTPLRQVSGFRITKAIDDQDQTLTQEETGNDPDNAFIGPGGGLNQRAMLMRMRMMGTTMGGPGTVTIPLKKGEKSSKSLKELTGTLNLQMLDVPETLMTMEDILKAGGRSVKGKADGEIKVVEVTKLENGQVKMQVELDFPPEITPAGQQAMGGGMTMSMPAIRLNAVLPAVPPPAPAPAEKPKDAPAKEEKPKEEKPKEPTREEKPKEPVKEEKPPAKAPPKDEKPAAKEKPAAPVPAALPAIAVAPPAVGGVWRDVASTQQATGDSFNGLSLLDEKGNKYSVSRVSTQFKAAAAGSVQLTYEITFAPKKDQGTAAKLVFSGSKTVAVEVPFTLKDVLLK
jgi:hypothetical protein